MRSLAISKHVAKFVKLYFFNTLLSKFSMCHSLQLLSRFCSATGCEKRGRSSEDSSESANPLPDRNRRYLPDRPIAGA